MIKQLGLALAAVVMCSCSSLPKSEVYSAHSKGSAGNAKDIVFIHGMFMTSDSWAEWQKYFIQNGYKTSAPAWPQHDKSVAEMNDPKNFEALAKVTLEVVLNHYRQILREKKVKPILIGHSMGGLVSQILLSENLASAAVVLDSAPPRGVFIISTTFLSANWKIITPFASKNKPIVLDSESFSANFCNTQSEVEQKRIYSTFAVPESKRVGLGPLTKVGSLNEENARGPLLLVGGSEDRIIPARLTYENFEIYEDTPGYTEFYLAEGKDHCLMLTEGWKALAETSRLWLEKQLVK